MAAITVSGLTAGSGSLTGTGVFDELMKAVEAHVKEEYSKGRIKGGDYATVYLGALQSVMDRSLQFMLQQQRTDLEAQLLQEQIQNAIAERTQIEAQTALTNQQKINLQAEKLQTEAQTGLIEQQTANAITEGTVLVAQECKLRGEYDLIMEQKLKTVAETALLNQKKVTEQAQTDGAGIGPDSVVGKQISLYEAQKDGYIRDAEQKAAKLLVDTWNVRKTMDDTTPVSSVNKLGDEYVGASVQRLLDGINATVV